MLEVPCETVIASIREPTDFSGLPIVVSGAVEFAPPRWAERLAEAGHGILFFDEISASAPAVQSALLRVVLERVVGDLVLPGDIRVVAAANPPGLAGDSWHLTPALANRFCHLNWTMATATFTSGFRHGWQEPPLLEPAAAWVDGLGPQRGLVADFIEARPSLLVNQPANPDAAGRGWPSARSWDTLARLLAAAEATGADTEVIAALARGTVGDGAGLEFLVWRERPDLPAPETLLADPEGIPWPSRPDLSYALLEAAVAAVADNPTADRWLAGWRVIARASAETPDAAAVAARTLARCRPPGVEIPESAKAFLPLLEAAGLI